MTRSSKKTITEAAFDSMFNKQIKVKKVTKAKNSKTEKNYDSDSSVEDHLIHPCNLNLDSDFYTSTMQKDEPQPNIFDCNAGLRLSDTSDEEGDFRGFKDITNQKKLIEQINRNSFANIEQIGEFSQNLEAERQKLIDYNARNSKIDEEDDINELLSLGEKSANSKNRKKKKSNINTEDWEEILHEKVPEKHFSKSKNIEVVISEGFSGTGKKRKKKDIDAILKRRMNLEKRKNQVFLHKASLACLVAHGNLLNSLINSRHLRKMALKLVPSQFQSLPKSKTNYEYFEQLTKLFRQVVILKENSVHPPLKKLPKLGVSLQLQMMKRHVVCRRDYALIFLLLLRALRVHCRMVMSLPVPPKNLPQSVLNPNSQKKSITKELKSIPQLDGNDDFMSEKAKKPKLANGDSASSSKKGAREPEKLTNGIKKPTSSERLVKNG